MKYRSEDTDKALDYARLSRTSSSSQAELAKSQLVSGILYIDVSNYDSGLHFLQNALQAFRSLKDTAGIADALHNIGVGYEYQGRYDSALSKYQRGYELRLMLGDKTEIASALNNIGNIYVSLNNYSKALELFLQALAVAQESGNRDLETDVFNNIGMVYDYNNDLDKALHYYFLAEKGYEQLHDNGGLAGTLNNIGIVYKNKGEPQKSIGYYERSLQLFKKIKSVYGEAVLLNNLGVAYGLLNNQREALSYHHRALQINTSIGNNDGIANSHNSIAECYNKLNDYRKAEDYYLKGLTHALRHNAKDRVLESYDGLALATEGQHDYQSAYKWLKKARTLKDSIFTIEKTQKLYEIEQKYEAALKEKQIALLNSESEKQKLAIAQQQTMISKRNIQLALVVSSLFLVGIVVYLFYSRMKILQTKRLSELKSERDQAIMKSVYEQRINIAKDMHDEIGSGLTHIAMLSELITSNGLADSNTKREMNAITETSRNLIQNMSEIIWAINPKNDTLDNLIAYLREQTTKYFEPFEIRFEFFATDHLPETKLTNLQRRNLFLVTKESLNNVMKHSQATNIRLEIMHENSFIHFKISDNGIGFDFEKIRRNANGLKNMKSRMEEIGGTFNISTSAKGTIASYTLPVAVHQDTTILTFS